MLSREETQKYSYYINCSNIERTLATSNLEALAKIAKLEKKVADLSIACKSAIPCLKDWIQTTGHGEVNRRDKASLVLIQQVLKELEG